MVVVDVFVMLVFCNGGIVVRFPRRDLDSSLIGLVRIC